jgi:hypothetical protein
MSGSRVRNSSHFPVKLFFFIRVFAIGNFHSLDAILHWHVCFAYSRSETALRASFLFDLESVLNVFTESVLRKTWKKRSEIRF